MARWVSGDAAGRICFFDSSAGSRVVRPYIGSSSSSSSSTYYQKLLQSQCSSLTFSGGWGGYDETEVTVGTSEGVLFAVSSQWPSPAAAAACRSSSSNYFGFPQTEGDAEVLRCSSLPYCVLLVQMLGVHTPELRRLLQYSELAATAAAAADFAYPGLDDAICCRSSSSCCSCRPQSSKLFGSDRQLLAVDKGGNGVVLNWCSSSSSSACESPELRRFSLREPLCCCSSNSLLLQQLAVASATAASFLSVYDIEENAFCFYAHAPPATAAAQTILRCSSSSSSSGQLGSCTAVGDGAAAAASMGTKSSSSSSGRVPVYAQVSPPWSCRGSSSTDLPHPPCSGGSSSKLQQQVCTSVSWLPRLGPSVLCGVTADALLLLYDTRASSFPVYIASTAAASAPPATAAAAAAAANSQATVGAPRPMVFVGAEPGLVAAHDQMEAAVLPCCCSCCSCTVCKRQQQQPQQQRHPQRPKESLFEGHRGRLVLKPHATSRRRLNSSNSSNSSSGGLPLLSRKLQQRIQEDFDSLDELHRRQSAPPKSLRNSNSKSAAAAAATAAGAPQVGDNSGCGAAETATTSGSNSNGSSSNNNKNSNNSIALRRQVSWGSALVSLSCTSDSPLTSFPTAVAAAKQQRQEEEQQQHQLPDEVLGWLATACYALVGSSLSLLLTEKYHIRQQLLQQAQQQLQLLLRSSCLPPEALQLPSSSAAAAPAAAANGKNRGSGSSNGCCSEESAAAAAARPLKKARVKGVAVAGKLSAASAAAAATTQPAGAAAGASDDIRHRDVLQQFTTQVLRLYEVLDPADSSSSSSELLREQQVQQQVPLLLQRQQQNVLRLLQYCAAFSFCFSQQFLKGSSAKTAATAEPAAASAMQQSELPELLLQQAAKEVLRRFNGLLSAAMGPAVAVAAAAAARSFVKSLRMGFGLAAQQRHLLFNMLLCWQQQQQQPGALLQDPVKTDAAEKAKDSCSSRTQLQQQQHQQSPRSAAAAVAPAVYIQRNCIGRLPISDALYFAIAKQQRSRNIGSSGKSSSNSSSSDSSSSSSRGLAVDTAQLVCCDTAGEISVLRVTVYRFKSHREKQLYIHRSSSAATAAASADLKSNSSKPFGREDDDPPWFPQLPQLHLRKDNHEEEAAAAAAAAAVAECESSGLSVGSECSCRGCCRSYSVRLELNFLAPRSSSSSSNLAIHSNGAFVLLASKDPYFALYGINPHLLPCSSRNRSKIRPLLGLALQPVAAARLQQQQPAAVDVAQPLLLSSAPLLPSVPMPPSLPPYLAAPPKPPVQVSLQRRFQQQQQQPAAAAAAASLGAAAWDTAIEFSDWLSEAEEPEWPDSDKD